MHVAQNRKLAAFIMFVDHGSGEARPRSVATSVDGVNPGGFDGPPSGAAVESGKFPFCVDAVRVIC